MHLRRAVLVLLPLACGPGSPNGGETTSGAATSGPSSPATATDGLTDATPTTSVGASTTGELPDGTSTTSTGVMSASTSDPACTPTTDVLTTDVLTTTGSDETGAVVHCGGMETIQLDGPGLPAGIEQCPNGSYHRHTAEDCPRVVLPCDDPASCDPSWGCGGFGRDECQQNCHGGCSCLFPCNTDADCPDDAACLCGSFVDLSYVVYQTDCYPANCRTDADCEPGFFCGLSSDQCGLATGLFCHTAADECQSDDDCNQAGLGHGCSFSSREQRWQCIEFIPCE